MLFLTNAVAIVALSGEHVLPTALFVENQVHSALLTATEAKTCNWPNSAT